ncbi:porin [Paenalcaligenes niemegkensis]|uniref:porin n=1 Tax=Paenalcaligenes niemegkensis TaxID=2895469 RepID=UPI001EE7E09C|nr:porin [Paenalcaligenes niemegkensis]MCQ9617906.1 porin [Paenalcaligenes niemegkensis]
MNKSLGTLLIGSLMLGLTGTANANLSMYGLIDLNVGSYKESGGTRENDVASGRFKTSFWGIKGEDKINDNLSSFFMLEGFFRADEGAAGRFEGDVMYARNSLVGLKGDKWGMLRIGRMGTSMFINTATYNPFADSFGFSPMLRNNFQGGIGRISGDTGWSNSINYTTPSAGGVVLTLHHQFKDNDQRANQSAALNYTGDRLAAGIVVQKVRSVFNEGSEDTWQVGASYDIDWMKFFAQYGESREKSTATVNANTKDHIYQAGVSVPVNQDLLMFSYSQARTTGAFTERREFLSLGYSHTLSARTDLYSMLMADKKAGYSVTPTFAVGVRHAF